MRKEILVGSFPGWQLPIIDEGYIPSCDLDHVSEVLKYHKCSPAVTLGAGFYKSNH